ncbi:MAG: hydantoinase/oxoprolinase family protein [Betaproteobacteria bacterium]|nr:hydantoinase/oxoprolinase family protein [Betaproteobacteria bacterium]
MTQYALGLDIGGTFTDIVVYDPASGKTAAHKELTTPDAPHRGVISGIRKLFEARGIACKDVSRVVHATTLFTNALIERKGAPTGLITTAGFRDTLEMRREHKYELYNLFMELPQPLTRRSLRLEAPERMGPDGKVAQALDVATLLTQVEKLKTAGVSSLAIAFLHAYANAAHEEQARAAIREKFPEFFVSLSSEVAPQIREYERTSTTVANAYIKPLADSYLDLMSSEIAKLGIEAPLFMMLSNGGLTHIDEAKRVPIQLLESGPAAGALAGSTFGLRSKARDVLAFDMGGTTAKLAIVENGEPLIAYQFEAGRQQRFMEGSGLPINISTIELIEIGAGGGSIATIDALGLLKVGPESAGAAPGPACYQRGGSAATVTDANLVLGYLDAGNFAGGTMKIDVELARAAIAPLAQASKLSVEQTAWGIHSVVNENMAAAARVHVAERGHHAGDFALLATGGGGPLHGCEVARRLGIKRVICPPSAGVASALGLLMAPARIDRVATVAKWLSELNWREFEGAFVKLEGEAGAVIAKTLSQRNKPTFVRAADMRFVGQGFELVVSLPRGPYTARSSTALRAAFMTVYRKTFGHVPPAGDIEIINIRVAVSAAVGKGELTVSAGKRGDAGALKGKRKAWVGARERFEELPVYDRYRLAVGAIVRGPAIVEEDSTTLILPPKASAKVERSGNLAVDLS